MAGRAFRAVAALALFAVLALLARLWSLEMPLSEDAGAYLYVADTSSATAASPTWTPPTTRAR